MSAGLKSSLGDLWIFYTGLLAHQHNSYLSVALIMPPHPHTHAPCAHLDVEKSAFSSYRKMQWERLRQAGCVFVCEATGATGAYTRQKGNNGFIKAQQRVLKQFGSATRSVREYTRVHQVLYHCFGTKQQLSKSTSGCKL